MMQAFFNGLSGLLTFSRGLKNVSNDVSNMNTPGFRGSETFFRSVNGEGENGLGAEVAGTLTRDTQGEFSQTNNATDVAINGSGFFILRSSAGDLYYSRAGQFKLDDKHQLVDAVTGYAVQGLDASGNLSGINIDTARILPPVATSKVTFTGNLVTGSSSYSISSVTVYDATGAKVTLAMNFTQSTTPNSWHVSVTQNGSEIGSGDIAFGTDGSPLAGSNTFDITLTSGGQSKTITLDFGQPGSFSNATQFSGASSTLTATAADGSASSALTSFSFDQTGTLQYTYANGQTRSGPQLALSDFADDTALRLVNASLYSAPAAMTPQIGKPGSGALGQIKGGYIELANVDLAQEFGDILIIQRGYQASSRVMTVANDMLDQLYGGKGGQ